MKGDSILLDAYTAHIVLGVKPTRIRQWVKRGHLTPRARHARRHLFAEEDIQALLDRA